MLFNQRRELCEGKMNFNVYLEDELGKQLEATAKVTGKKRNTIVREAIELWLSVQREAQWSSSLLEFEGVDHPLSFESYRDELTSPQEITF